MILSYTYAAICFNDIYNCKQAIQYLQTAVSIIHTSNIKYSSNDSAYKDTFTHLFISSDYEYIMPDIMTQYHIAYNDFVPKSHSFLFPNILSSSSHTKIQIRIGYVSSDFDNHVVSHFIIPILLNHTEVFEVHCFSNRNASTSGYFNDFVAGRVKIHNVASINDLDLATYINQIGIHILIDLNGHTKHNRLEMFALNPCPVQITYLGFPNSTGLDCIHYRITDTIADHPESNQHYCEKLLRMPRFFLLFNNLLKIHVSPKQVDHGRIVIGSLNRESKISKYLIDAWRKILRECPNTTILIKTSREESSRAQYYMDVLDIPRDRLILVGFVADENAVAGLYSQIDILMDTFPYSGTTTSCKSLFYSVPVITKYNKNYHANNVSASLLIHCGFDELVAYSDDEYVSKTVQLIRDPDRISYYKRLVKPRFEELMQPDPFMKSYEDLLMTCLHERCVFQ